MCSPSRAAPIPCSTASSPPSAPCQPAPFNPGFRNEFHAGFEQAFSKHLVVNADYIWKYTHNAYDFSVLGATPITFPIEWHNSKIPGFVLKATVPETHGVSGFVAMSSVAARFFNPQIGGVGTTPGTTGSTLPFRIDHDERFNQTTQHAVRSALPQEHLVQPQLALRQRSRRRLRPLL